MFESLKVSWKKIQQDPPGKRFRRQYRRRQASRDSIAKRVLFMMIGGFILFIGLVMLFTPGPGLLFFFLGWGLIAQESLLLAVLLDKLEVYLRKWADWGKETWSRMSLFLKSILILLTLIVTALVLYAGYWAFLA